jgi:putative IMPACT (imprinted ancient) family translation regulator
MNTKYIIQDSEAGNVIEEVSSFEEAQKVVDKYETIDKNEGTYTPDFYEIVEVLK